MSDIILTKSEQKRMDAAIEQECLYPCGEPEIVWNEIIQEREDAKIHPAHVDENNLVCLHKSLNKLMKKHGDFIKKHRPDSRDDWQTYTQEHNALLFLQKALESWSETTNPG